MARDWQFAVQETIGANRSVSLPPTVREVIEFDHPLDGPSIYWNYERHSKFVVLSRGASRFTTGSRVVYLAYEEMTAGENPTVYD